MSNVISFGDARKARPHRGHVVLVAEYGEQACIELMIRDEFYYVAVPRYDAAVLFQRLETSLDRVGVVMEFIRSHPWDEFGVDCEDDEEGA